jgi:predicted nucleic acid-binding protein
MPPLPSVVAVLVDTSVLIDLLRGHAAARDYLRGLDEPPLASEVTRVEVLRGLRPVEREPTERLFDALRWVAVGEAIARRAGELGRRWDRHRPGIALADLVIAASAEHLGADLATTNVRHFPMFPELTPPYRA